MKCFPLLLLFLAVSFFLQGQGLDREKVRKVKDAIVFLEVEHQHPLEEGSVESSGSGFFIDEHGRIATNHHVISSWVTAMGLPYPAPVEHITAFIHSGTDEVKKIPYRVLTQDRDDDLAILLPRDTFDVPGHLELGDTDELYETMTVWAFGYPHGKEHSVLQKGPEVTVTKGGISALRHDDRDTLQSIQMDASVAPGNSGGPLITTEGKAIGVVHRRGDNKMNHAVPAHFLQRMNERLPEGKLPASIPFALNSDPEGAELFIDGKEHGSTPFSSEDMEAGFHRFTLHKKGYRVRYGKLPLIGETDLHEELEVVEPHPLTRGEELGDPPEEERKPPTWSSGELLIEENFDDPERFRSWEQNTGGLSERTWYLEDGRLRQHQRDGTLHAITLNTVDPDPHRITAKVKLPGDGDGDDRAGLIFGDDPNGFYLFRIYRESDQAELAYHSRSPFGWNILQRTSLDQDLASDEWYELSISVIGKQVICSIDGDPVIDAGLPSLDAGKLGFYSVESRPVFDSLRVNRLKLEEKNGAQLPSFGKGGSTTESFWFTDRFDLSSGWWWSSDENGEAVSPVVTDVGMMVRAKGKEVKMDFQRYLLADMRLDMILSTGEGGEDASFECRFFEQEDSDLTLRFESDSVVRLIHRSAGEEMEIRRDTLGSSFFGGPTLLKVLLNGRNLHVSTRFSDVMDVELPKELDRSPGRFGFRLQDVRGVFHRMTVSSVDRSGE